jgi:hypothetical protein
VCWDRAGVLCRTRVVVWWLWEASRHRVCVPGCQSAMWGDFGAFIWSECPSKKLKEGGKGPEIALSRLNFASFGPIKVI